VVLLLVVNNETDCYHYVIYRRLID